MPSLLRHRACPVCGAAHDFCRPTGPIAPGQTFSFRCPRADRAGQFRADAVGEESRFYPTGAVSLGAPVPPGTRDPGRFVDEN